VAQSVYAPTIAVRGLILFGSALVLAGCAITEAVAVVSKGIPGGVMRGTTTASLSGGSFSASNGSLTCGGDYNDLDTCPTISIPVLCSDGCKSTITATRDYSGMSGGGTSPLTTARPGDFMFGAAAGKL
jgi:hypothetical protein